MKMFSIKVLLLREGHKMVPLVTLDGIVKVRTRLFWIF